MKHNLNIVTENGGYMLVVIDPITASVVTARPFDYALLEQHIADQTTALDAAMVAIIGPEEPVDTIADPPVLVGSTKAGYPIYAFSIFSKGFDPVADDIRLMYRLELVEISDSIESINLHVGSSMQNFTGSAVAPYVASSTAMYFFVENNSDINTPPNLIALHIDGSVAEIPIQSGNPWADDVAIAASATAEYIASYISGEIGNISSMYGIVGNVWKGLTYLESGLYVDSVQSMLAAVGVAPEYIQADSWCSNSYGYFRLDDNILYQAYDDSDGVDLTPIISDVAGEGYTIVTTTFYTADTLPLVYFWQNFEKAAEQP